MSLHDSDHDGVVRTFVGLSEVVKRLLINWGEPERAPHRRVCCEFSIYLFIYIYRTSCRKSLPARILRVIASCVNSNHKRTHHCNVNDIDTNVETIARGEGLKHFMKTGKVLQAISCPAVC